MLWESWAFLFIYYHLAKLLKVDHAVTISIPGIEFFEEGDKILVDACCGVGWV
jgi:hypothetical protein